MSFLNSTAHNWFGSEFKDYPDLMWVDESGYFQQVDGATSRVVYKFDTFALKGYKHLEWWLGGHGLWYDKVPISFQRELQRQEYERQQAMPPVAAPSDDGPPARTVTDTGIDLTDPKIYETVDLYGDSSTATVISMATNYDLETYERFVGSLRKSGFKGNIILAVDEADLSPEVRHYFEYRNVTAKIVEMIPAEECVKTSDNYLPIVHAQPCSKAYPHLKATWARHSLFRDWLKECETCTGPVLYIDSRDSYFQDDPFGEGSPPVRGLQVYQVGGTANTKISYVGDAIRQCKNLEFEEPMLCAGSTVGTMDAMLKYLEIMIQELTEWISNPDCSFSDQGVHNYL